uniref:PepSY domain-containing protein n=1 Tax=Mesocestoides corti TaxID=53468 RepID=A0A5K3FW44_MESCO
MSRPGGVSVYRSPSAEEIERFTPVLRNYITEKLGKEPKLVEIRRINSQVTDKLTYILEVLHESGVWKITLSEAPQDNGVTLSVVGHESLTVN